MADGLTPPHEPESKTGPSLRGPVFFNGSVLKMESMNHIDSEKNPRGKAYAVRDGAGPHDDGDVVRDLQSDLFP